MLFLRLLCLGLTAFILISPSVQAQVSRSPTRTHQRRDAQMHSVVLSGLVLNEQGDPLPEQVQVDLVCNGRIRMQTVTAPDGSFAFQMDSPREEDWMDPSIGGSADGTLESTVKVRGSGGTGALDEVPSMGRGRVTLSGCEVRAAPRPGKTSNVITLSTREALGDPDIGTIIIRKVSDGVGPTVSVSFLGAPEKARKAFDKANEEFGKGKPDLDRAARELEKAVREYPEFSAAWDLLARAELSRGRREAGRTAFLRAVESEAGFLPPQIGLAQMAVQEGSWKEALIWTEKILALDPVHPQGLYWDGLAHYYLSEFEQAEKSLSGLYRQGHQKQYPFGLLPLGVIHANQGRIPDAAAELSRYLELMPSEQVPVEQRAELERQLAEWKADGIRPTDPGP